LDREVDCTKLWQDLRQELHWEILESGRNPHLRVDLSDGNFGDGASLVGFLSFIRSHWVQVVGRSELEYLLAHPEQIPQFRKGRLEILVLCEDVQLPREFATMMVAEGVAIFRTSLPTRRVLVRLQHYLRTELAPRCLLHGVLVDILGVGILIQGEAGIGKSELALELVSRQHRLVADDSVLCIREAPDVVTGHCPSALQDFLEVRGLGIVNIRQLFGAAAVIDSKRLRLVVEIRDMSEMELADVDRLQGQVDHLSILGVDFPRLRLPVSAARNLAVLVEAAARGYYVSQSGVDMLAHFDAQTRRLQTP